MRELAPTPEAFLLRIAVAVAMGAIVGFERQWRQRTAGIHTVILVAVGAALFGMMPPLLQSSTAEYLRVAAAIVTGVGFLAGAVIFREGADVRGLNTAATIWATSAAGILIGFGFYGQGITAAIAITAVNLVFQPLVDLIARRSRPAKDVRTLYDLRVICTSSVESDIRDVVTSLVSETSLRLDSLATERAGDGNTDIHIKLSKIGRDDKSVEAFLKRLNAREAVISTAWDAQESWV